MCCSLALSCPCCSTRLRSCTCWTGRWLHRHPSHACWLCCLGEHCAATSADGTGCCYRRRPYHQLWMVDALAGCTISVYTPRCNSSSVRCTHGCHACKWFAKVEYLLGCYRRRLHSRFVSCSVAKILGLLLLLPVLCFSLFCIPAPSPSLSAAPGRYCVPCHGWCAVQPRCARCGGRVTSSSRAVWRCWHWDGSGRRWCKTAATAHSHRCGMSSECQRARDDLGMHSGLAMAAPFGQQLGIVGALVQQLHQLK